MSAEATLKLRVIIPTRAGVTPGQTGDLCGVCGLIASVNWFVVGAVEASKRLYSSDNAQIRRRT